LSGNRAAILHTKGGPSLSLHAVLQLKVELTEGRGHLGLCFLLASQAERAFLNVDVAVGLPAERCFAVKKEQPARADLSRSEPARLGGGISGQGGKQGKERNDRTQEQAHGQVSSRKIRSRFRRAPPQPWE